MKKLSILFIILSLFIIGCEKHNIKSIPDTDSGYDYYPTKIGSYVIYEFKEITHDKPSEILDTVEYRIKEVIDSEFTNEVGEKTLRIERYIKVKSTKPYDSLDWQIKDVWTANKTTSGFVKNEENFKYIKLIFPIKENEIWDMNATNINDPIYVEYIDIGKSKTINNITFSSTVTVFDEKKSAIDRNSSTEVYAKDIGLVYRKVDDVRFTQINSTEIETGTELIVNYISHN